MLVRDFQGMNLAASFSQEVYVGAGRDSGDTLEPLFEGRSFQLKFDVRFRGTCCCLCRRGAVTCCLRTAGGTNTEITGV
jgi:hypothetical protein